MNRFFNKKNLAFTLAEMMVILAIFSIISAATLPVITAKNNLDVSESATGGYFPDPWKEDYFSAISYYDANSPFANKAAVIVGGQVTDDAYSIGYPQLIVKDNNVDDKISSSQIVLTKRNDANIYIGGRIAMTSPIYNDVNNYGSIALGYEALGHPVASSSSDYDLSQNIAVGSYASYVDHAFADTWVVNYTQRADSVAIGDKALFIKGANRSSRHVAVGAYAGYEPVSGAPHGVSNNIFVGYYSGFYDGDTGSGSSNKIAIGSYAGLRIRGSNDISVGTYSGAVIGYGTSGNNVDIGFFAGYYGLSSSTAQNMVRIGSYAGAGNGSYFSMSNMVAIGLDAGRNTVAYIPSVSANSNGIYIGKSAGENSKSGFDSRTRGGAIMIGAYAGFYANSASSGSEPWYYNVPTIIGYYAGAGSGVVTSASDSYPESRYPVIIGTRALETYANSYKRGICQICGYEWEGTAANAPSICPSCHSATLTFSDLGGLTGLPAVTIGYYAGRFASGNMNGSILIGSYAAYYANLLQKTICIGTNTCSYSAGGMNDVRIAPYGVNDISVTSVNNPNLRSGTSYIGNPRAMASQVSNAIEFTPVYNKTSLYSNLLITPLSADYTSGDYNYSSILLHSYYKYGPDNANILSMSDKRLKRNIKPSKYGLNDIKKIKVYEYKFKEDKSEHPYIGVIAQEMQEVVPEGVHKLPSGYLTVNADWLMFPMINAIQELDKSLTNLQNSFKSYVKEYISLVSRVNNLEKDIKKLEKENKSLTKEVNIAYAKAKRLKVQGQKQ